VGGFVPAIMVEERRGVTDAWAFSNINVLQSNV
jgi:hypothetical protein